MLALAALAVAALALPAGAGAHAERATFFPDPDQGAFPEYRATGAALVVCADDDLLAPPYFSEEYVRLIPGARAHFATSGGHALTKTEADLFNRIALEFFTELMA